MKRKKAGKGKTQEEKKKTELGLVTKKSSKRDKGKKERIRRTKRGKEEESRQAEREALGCR